MLLIPLLLQAALAGPAYVHADLLHVRAGPDPAAERVARLRVNTPVRVLQAQPGWREIELLSRPEAHPVRGWVASDYLGERPLEVAELREQLGQASEAGDAWGALELARRLVALDGREAEDWRRLLEAAQAANYAPEIARAEGWLRGAHPVSIGVCHGGRVEMALQALPEQALHSLTNGREVAARRGPLARAADGMTWYLHPSDGRDPQAVRGSPFVTPFLDEVWNAESRLAYPLGLGERLDAEGEAVLVLGPCDDEGAVYASRPLGLPRPRALSLDDPRLAQLPAPLPYEATPTTLWEVGAGLALQARGRTRAHYDEIWFDLDFVMFMDPSGAPTPLAGRWIYGDAHHGVVGGMQSLRWFSLPLGQEAQPLVIGVVDADDKVWLNAALITDAGQAWGAFAVLEGYGC